MNAIKSIIPLTFLFTSLLMAGCKKNWLDAKPNQNQAVPQTAKDFRAMLDYYFDFLVNAPALTEIAADYHTMPESTWENIKNTNEGNAFVWTDEVPYAEISDWMSSYAAVFHCNIILTGLKKISETAMQQDITSMKGEALFYRGRIFYELAMTFAPPLDPQNGESPYGIPLRIEADIELPTQRSTLNETYSQILNDLRSSYELLPATSNFMSRPTKVSALGFLARVYLSIERYDSAYYYADQYLKVKSELADYNSFPLDQPFIGTNTEIGNLNFLLPYSSMYNFQITSSHVNKYDTNDLRKTLFFQDNAGEYIFKGTYGKTQSNVYSGVATDEMMLIRAECFARSNDLTSALKDLNTLARTRYKKIDGQSTYLDFTSTVQENVLSKILQEREKQLILRNVRWTDLRRLNKDPRFAQTLTRTIGGKTYKLEPKSYKYTFPIPAEVIERSGIKQNPGW